jgi:hypothetical protein
VSGAGEALTRFSGGTHTLGTLAGRSMFELTGTTTTTELIDGVLVTYGNEKLLAAPAGLPLARPLLSATNSATINTSRAARFDHVLFEATAPIFRLLNSHLNVNSIPGHPNAIDLNMAKVVRTGSGPLVSLDASNFIVQNGAVVNLHSSYLDVAGDLFSLINGSKLQTFNGPIARVGPNSVLKVNGAFVAYGGTGGNQVLVNAGGGPKCGESCVLMGGIPILVLSGTANITNGIKEGHLGTVPGSTTSPWIVVDGGKVTVSGN